MGRRTGDSPTWPACLPGVEAVEWCSIERMPQVGDDSHWRTALSYDEESDETVFIILSSGSTGDPKPIPWNHRRWQESSHAVAARPKVITSSLRRCVMVMRE